MEITLFSVKTITHNFWTFENDFLTILIKTDQCGEGGENIIFVR